MKKLLPIVALLMAPQFVNAQTDVDKTFEEIFGNPIFGPIFKSQNTYAFDELSGQEFLIKPRTKETQIDMENGRLWHILGRTFVTYSQDGPWYTGKRDEALGSKFMTTFSLNVNTGRLVEKAIGVRAEYQCELVSGGKYLNLNWPSLNTDSASKNI